MKFQTGSLSDNGFFKLETGSKTGTFECKKYDLSRTFGHQIAGLILPFSWQQFYASYP